jgi:hypothetical protein
VRQLVAIGTGIEAKPGDACESRVSLPGPSTLEIAWTRETRSSTDRPDRHLSQNQNHALNTYTSRRVHYPVRGDSPVERNEARASEVDISSGRNGVPITPVLGRLCVARKSTMNASAGDEQEAGEYVSAAAITRATGFSLVKLYGAVVRRVVPPGRPPRYSIEDARRLTVDARRSHEVYQGRPVEPSGFLADPETFHTAADRCPRNRSASDSTCGRPPSPAPRGRPRRHRGNYPRRTCPAFSDTMKKGTADRREG